MESATKELQNTHRALNKMWSKEPSKVVKCSGLSIVKAYYLLLEEQNGEQGR